MTSPLPFEIGPISKGKPVSVVQWVSPVRGCRFGDDHIRDTFSTISINRIVDTIRIKQWWTLGGCLGRTTAPEKRSLGHLQCAKHKIGVSAAPLCSTAYQIFLGSMQYLNNFPFMVIVSEITPPTVAVFVLREL